MPYLNGDTFYFDVADVVVSHRQVDQTINVAVVEREPR